MIAQRRAEADEFYEAITPPAVDEDAKAVMRQALSGMLWSKQCYYFDVDRWLRERSSHPLRAPTRRGTRNESWSHMVNQDVVSMPDKWEYPWYAAWDLAFHCVPLAMIDPDFAKHQIQLMISQEYLHPSAVDPVWSIACSTNQRSRPCARGPSLAVRPAVPPPRSQPQPDARRTGA